MLNSSQATRQESYCGLNVISSTLFCATATFLSNFALHAFILSSPGTYDVWRLFASLFGGALCGIGYFELASDCKAINLSPRCRTSIFLIFALALSALVGGFVEFLAWLDS